MKTEILCNLVPWSRQHVQLLVLVHHANQTSVARSMNLEVMEENGFIEQPTMTLEREAAQQLMDQLWICGLRPSEGSGSAGSLAATERHLKDMQTIAMGLLKQHGVGA